MKMLLIILLVFTSCSSAIAQNDSQRCPTLNIYAPEFSTKPDETIIFIASVENYANPAKVKYQWGFSGGKIIEGQGTPTIKIKQQSDYVMAFVEFEGLPENCGNLASTASIPFDPPLPFLFDGYTSSEYPYEYTGSYSLSNNIELRPDSKVFVIQNFSRNASEKIIKSKILKTLKNLSYFEPIKSDGVTFAVNKSGLNSTQIWIVPAGASFPECKNCQIKNYKFSEFFKD